MNIATAPVLATQVFAEGLFTTRVETFDFIGPDRVTKTFGLSLDPATVPVIPFTEEELTRSRKLGQFLILHTPTTMLQIHDRLGNKLGDGKILYAVDWYPEEPFYTTEATRLEWMISGRDVIPESTGVNYLVQTGSIATYLREQVYAGMKMPAAYQTAIEEFESQKVALEKLMNSNWKEAVERLCGLKLNRFFRGTPVQTLYNSVVYFKTNSEYLLPGKYHWTASRSSDGHLVSLGDGRPDGVRVGGRDPMHSVGDLGVVFSRGAVPDLVS